VEVIERLVSEIDQQLETLKAARDVLANAGNGRKTRSIKVSSGNRNSRKPTATKGRSFSAAAKKRMSIAQKQRWAEKKKLAGAP
jgi:hypothetical protein